MKETGMDELYEARSELEAWEYAWSVMEPLTKAIDATGHPQTSLVMLHALAEVTDNLRNARTKLEEIQARD